MAVAFWERTSESPDFKPAVQRKTPLSRLNRAIDSLIWAPRLCSRTSIT